MKEEEEEDKIETILEFIKYDYQGDNTNQPFKEYALNEILKMPKYRCPNPTKAKEINDVIGIISKAYSSECKSYLLSKVSDSQKDEASAILDYLGNKNKDRINDSMKSLVRDLDNMTRTDLYEVYDAMLKIKNIIEPNRQSQIKKPRPS